MELIYFAKVAAVIFFIGYWIVKFILINDVFNCVRCQKRAAMAREGTPTPPSSIYMILCYECCYELMKNVLETHLHDADHFIKIPEQMVDREGHSEKCIAYYNRCDHIPAANIWCPYGRNCQYIREVMFKCDESCKSSNK